MRARGGWIRLYENVMGSPKILRLPDSDYRFWTYLLLIAGRSQTGSLPAVNDLALLCRCSPSCVRMRTSRLLDAGLVDLIDGVYKMHDWDEWQYVSDKSTPRVQNTVPETPTKRY